MANSKTDAFERDVLNYFLAIGQTAPTRSAGLYIALFTASPTESGAVTNEVSGNGYARQPVTFGAAATASGVSSVANTNDVLFPVATPAGYTVTHFGICKAGTAGVADILYFDAFSSSQAILVNQQLDLPIGAIVITEE